MDELIICYSAQSTVVHLKAHDYAASQTHLPEPISLVMAYFKSLRVNKIFLRNIFHNLVKSLTNVTERIC